MNERLDDFLSINNDKIRQLPTLPVVAKELMSLSQSDTLEADTIVEIISKDPAISTKILSVTNSAYYKITTPVNNIKEAIIRLGFKDVKNIALSASVLEAVNTTRDKKTPYRLDYQRTFRHSMVVAMIGRSMAHWLDKSVADDVFTAGLLHDIGLLLLNKFFTERYVEVMNLFRREVSLIEAENKTFGFTHAEIGGWLLTNKWEMTDLIANIVNCHHTPSVAKSNEKHVSIIHLSDFLASKNMHNATSRDPLYPFDETALDILEISEDEFDEFDLEVRGMVFY